MNLRISDGQLRFRITREELAALLQGKPLEISLPLKRAFQHYRISCNNLDSPLQLREDSAGLTMVVDHVTLDEFRKQLPSREGIEHQITLNGENLLLVLEVDVRRLPR